MAETRYDEIVIPHLRPTFVEILGIDTVEPIPDPDTQPPQIQNISPANLQIRKNTFIEFDIIDDISLAYTGIIVEYSDNTTEIVHDGFEFSAQFPEPANSRTVIENGYHYRIRRNGGWTKKPFIKPIVIDTSGNLGEVAE